MSNVVPDAMRAVSSAAKAFESRWSLQSLRVLDPELHARLEAQQSLWHEAMVTGSAGDVREQTDAMCRGWRAVTERMEKAGAPDDAYLLGTCPKTGLRVAIGDQTAAMDRVREIHGQKVVWMTPNEVATLLAGTQAIAAIKQAFPGAEVIDLYRKEEPECAA